MRLRSPLVAFTFILVIARTLAAQSTLDTIGVTQLRNLNPALTGSGVIVAQVEAPVTQGGNDFEVNPGAIGQSQALFSYINSSGSAVTGTFPNAVGSESGHADAVGSAFYGTAGVAYGVNHVYNYNANYFFNSLVVPNAQIPAKVVNQSFIFISGSTIASYDKSYDTYTVNRGTIFVSGIGNDSRPSTPATAYNSIGVAAYGGSSAVGPTTDGLNRSKPDITAPAGATSFSTPLVAGAAAILVQSGTAANASDPITVKALLLNGAAKPSDWTHTSTAPLDTRYGAGVLNIYNSYVQLQGGRHTFTIANATQTPTVTGSSVGLLAGWDNNSLTSSSTANKVNHYFFDLSAVQGSVFTVTSTLVWNRQSGKTAINNLDLFLYNSTGTLVASSVSTVDNVEHLFIQNLPPGRYDLQVLKHLGSPPSTVVSNSETYALAFDFSSIAFALSISTNGNDVVIHFPSTAGHTYRVERSSDLSAGLWSTFADNLAGTGSTMQVVDMDALNQPGQFYRLRLLQ